jgi:hypothetical protein
MINKNKKEKKTEQTKKKIEIFFIKFDFLCPYLNNKSLFNLFIHIEDGYSSDM